MAQRSAVPKFGNWENGDNVPYTVYFEKARKSKNSNGGGSLRANHRPTDSPISEPPARVSSGRRCNRNSGGSGGSPAYWRERKGSPDGAIGQAPARSRLRSADDCAVPKFGEWDENNPASADGYTLIFNNVSQRRNGGSAKSLSSSSYLSNQNSLTTQHTNPTSKSVSCCCWG